MIMSGIIRFVDFEDIKEARPLTLQKYGTVQFNQDFSKEPVTMKFVLKEYSKQTKDFYEQYFFDKKNKQAFATGTMGYNPTDGFFFVISKLEFTTVKQ